ncbi:MAG: hypothetical protein K6F58_01700 [Bacteroidales bacterium]|nr:hypothetical protein [Bacteroidales bacterium]
MKHYFIPMMLMAIVALASCEKQIVPSEQKAKTYTYSISAVAPDMQDAEGSVPAQAPVTRTDYDGDGHFSWSAGDAISVLFHNGDVNKFFTLTTTGSGASATFSGEIEAGYTIGASDGTESDKKIWALFPASANHTYTAGSNPTFYVQPSVDFSATHFSANIPMYDLVASEGTALSFKNLASTYKFIVNGIKDGVSKVTFRIHNQTTYGLSGAWPIHNDLYLKYDYADPGSANSTLTYTSDVTSNQAVFYVSCRYWGTFQPVITVTDYSSGVAIKTFTANNPKTPNYKDHVWPITLDVSEANGGEYFAPAIIIDGNFSDWSALSELDSTRGSGSSNSRISHWKMTSDSRYVYIYLKLVTANIKADASSYVYVGFDTAEGGTSHGGLAGLEHYVVVYPSVSGSSPMELIQGTDPRSTVDGSSDGTLATWGEFGTGGDANYSFVELRIPRSKVSLNSAGTIKVAVSFDWYDTIFHDLTLN